jgi:manganese efflux pump family protein
LSGFSSPNRQGVGHRSYRGPVVALLLVAVSLGADNFAAAIAIGVSGVDARTRLRVGLVFGAFEAGMPVLGLIIGAQTAGLLGHAARWTGAGLLIAAGGYAVIAAARERAVAARERAESRGRTAGASPGATSTALGPLLLTGLALSLDNLVVGFALGASHTSVVVGAIVIGVVSAALSLAGLEVGARAGKWAGERGEQLAGLLLILVGIALGTGLLS